jgi:hypothetical protein
MIELYDGVVRPKALPNLVTRDHFTGRLEEHSKNLERLLLKSNPAPLLA